jgi:hypothetical protein
MRGEEGERREERGEEEEEGRGRGGREGSGGGKKNYVSHHFSGSLPLCKYLVHSQGD